MARPTNTQKLADDFKVTTPAFETIKSELKEAIKTDDAETFANLTEVIRAHQENVRAVTRFQLYMLDNIGPRMGADSIVTTCEPVNGRRERQAEGTDKQSLSDLLDSL